MNHADQRAIWEDEHRAPHVLPQMDARTPSAGVVRFWNWLKTKALHASLTGVEMGCGKGRNSIYLGGQGAQISAFDFSEHAIAIAQNRAVEQGVKIDFAVHDATLSWPYADHSFDFGIDCFASTDIETPVGRAFARDEFRRVLKLGGFLLVYTLSVDDEFHAAMRRASPGVETGSFHHPSTGKFEKVFDRGELLAFYRDFTLVAEERIETAVEFKGQKWLCRHFWMIYCT